MERKRIGIDVDGVLRDFNKAAVEVYNREFGENKRPEDMTEYDLGKSYPLVKDAEDFFFRRHPKELFFDAEVIAGARDAFNHLYMLHDVVILTTQPTAVQKIYTIEWLVKNGFNFNDLCFLHDKNKFGRLDYFIDDNPKKFDGVDAGLGVLIDAPYNKSADIRDLKGCDLLTRCGSLFEFVRKFEL